MYFNLAVAYTKKNHAEGQLKSPILITPATAAEVSGVDSTGNPRKVTPDIQEHDLNRALNCNDQFRATDSTRIVVRTRGELNV